MSGKIEVVGLGAGDIDQLPLGIYKKITSTGNLLIARTLDHPVITALTKEGIHFQSYDDLYEAEEAFNQVYEQITADLLTKAKDESVLYAVPGHPMLAEKTVQLLLKQDRCEVRIIGGQSYLDDLFTALKIDPVEGLQFVDGTGFERSELNYRQHLVFSQVYDPLIASQVKLALLEDLPFDYEVTIIDAAGSESETIRQVPLERLDHQFAISNLTSVYVPPVPKELLNHTFVRLREVIATLRGPEGSQWERQQTHESLQEFLLEEVYELIEAITNQDDDGIVEELGDILLQVMLHSQIGEDKDYFTIDDVVQSITIKMLHRHPQVFSKTPNRLNQKWEELKQEEDGKQRESKLEGIPPSLPALLKADRLQKRAATVGFTEIDSKDIGEKLTEDVAELVRAAQVNNREKFIHAYGKALFTIVRLTRYQQMNPELLLEQANQKFTSRFSYLEKKLTEDGKVIEQTSLEEMNRYWEKAKKGGTNK